MLRSAPGRLDAGAGWAGHAAVLLLVAAIVALMLPPPPADRAFEPGTCDVMSAMRTYGPPADITFFQVGEDLTFVRATNAEGEVTVTVVNGTTAGLSTGADINWGRTVHFGANAITGANVKIGDGWLFRNQGNAAEFLGEVQKQATYDAIQRSGPLGWIGGHIGELIGPADMREPDIERHEVVLNGDAGAAAGVSIGPRDLPGGDSDDRDTRGGNRSGHLHVDAQEKALVEQNKQEGTTTVTVPVEGGARAGGGYVINGREFRGQVAGTVNLTYDYFTRDDYGNPTRENVGNLRRLTLIRTTIVNHHLDASLVEEQTASELAYRYLGENRLGADGAPAAIPLRLTWDDMAPVNPPGPDASPLQQILYEHGGDFGLMQRVGYDDETLDSSFGAGVKLGLRLGLGVPLSRGHQRATSAQYFAAEDDSRQWWDFPECAPL